MKHECKIKLTILAFWMLLMCNPTQLNAQIDSGPDAPPSEELDGPDAPPAASIDMLVPFLCASGLILVVLKTAKKTET